MEIFVCKTLTQPSTSLARRHSFFFFSSFRFRGRKIIKDELSAVYEVQHVLVRKIVSQMLLPNK
jgi:hypothetical protein